jgi:hypothetical protein
LWIDGSDLTPEFVPFRIDVHKSGRELKVESLRDCPADGLLNIQADHDQFVLMFGFDPIHDGLCGDTGKSIVALKLEQHRLSIPDAIHHLVSLVHRTRTRAQKPECDAESDGQSCQCDHVIRLDTIAQQEYGKAYPSNCGHDRKRVLIYELHDSSLNLLEIVTPGLWLDFSQFNFGHSRCSV